MQVVLHSWLRLVSRFLPGSGGRAAGRCGNWAGSRSFGAVSVSKMVVPEIGWLIVRNEGGGGLRS
jgi:hypothetical protein